MEIIMYNKAIKYCKNNQFDYETNDIILCDIKAQLIKIKIKKLFAKTYNLYFIESDDFKQIENVVKSLVDYKSTQKDNLILFCKTELDINEEQCCYTGADMQQIIYCVYLNKTTNKYSYYVDIDTPKLSRNIIKYVTN